MKDILQIKQEFEQVSIPLPKEEQEKLEERLIRQGCMEPIITWHGYILDGHKRYRTCNYEEIEFEVQETDFDTKEEAITWICRERLSGMEHKNAAYRYLVGKWYITQKEINRRLRKEKADEINARIPMDRMSVIAEIYGVAPDFGNDIWNMEANADGNISAGEEGDIPAGKDKRRRKKNVRSDSIWDTSVFIALALGVDHSTVEKYGAYATALDRIAASEPALVKAILSGEAYFSHFDTIKMSRADERKLADIRRRTFSSDEEKMRKRAARKKKKEMIAMKEAASIPLAVGIKEMPAFDPDMELNGLGYTIPTWINRIARAENNTDMLQATETAKGQLADMLKRLKEQIEHTLEVLG